MLDKVFFEKQKESVRNGSIEYVNLAQIDPEIIEERHVRFTMPVDTVHLNHVGTVYAGSEFVLAEVAGGNLFAACYGLDVFVPILKGVEVRYLKPSTKTLIVDISLSEEEAIEKLKPIEERGRGDFFLDIPVFDIDGVQVAQMNFNYYAIPATMDFAASSK